MAHEVFISYRKSISQYQAQILKTRIDLEFGKDTAFLDNDDLQIGGNWANTLKQKLEAAKVIIVVIGPKWVYSQFDFTDEAKGIYEGSRRIDHPEDWVCWEIEAGHVEKKAFPVYMGGAKIGDVNPNAMPKTKPYLKAFFEEIQGYEISEKQTPNEFNPIFEALKKIIPQPPPPIIDKITLHDFHKYTCDRRVQLSEFEEIYENKQAQKIQFYYVLGKKEHAHYGFVNRVTYEKTGHLLYIEEPINLTNTPSIKKIVLNNYGGLDQLKKRLIRELFIKLGINANANAPILEKNIQFISAQSPIIQQMNAKDFVSIQISIYEDEWDEEETPALVKWFIYQFCQLPLPEEKSVASILPENTPTFLFFFSILFDEADSDIMDFVQDEVDKSHYIKALPKLTMVTKKDVEKWFRKYSIITPYTKTRDAIIDKYFEKQEVYEMETVQINLKKIIDDFNNQ